MMANKWVQAALLLGVAVGVWIGGWLPLIHPALHLVVPITIGFLAMWVGANARGTDGWGGPYRGA
jgi:hypothetical protein